VTAENLSRRSTALTGCNKNVLCEHWVFRGAKKLFFARKGQKYAARKIGIFFVFRNNAGEKCVL